MGGLQSALLVSVLIRAIDMASPVMARMAGTGLAQFGLLQGAAVAVGAAIAAIGAYSVDSAVKFDMQMQKIAALTTTSGDQMAWYKQQILDLAPSLDQSPTALAQGLYFVISAGYQASDAINILKLSAQAAAATMTPMKDVSDLLTTSMNAFRVQGLSAGRAMDDIIKIVVNGKVTMSSLATSFGFVAVTAANAGLTFDETSAAVSALSQVAGEHGARRVMMDLDNALRNLGPKMEDVSKKAMTMKGLKAPWDAAAFAAMNFGDKIKYIAEETGGIGYLDKTQAAAYMATGNFTNLAQATAHANKNFMELVGGAAAFLPMAMLLGDKLGSYNDILKQMGGNGEATATAFDKMRESTGQKWKMFQTTLETIATVLGEKLLPTINRILDPLIQVGHQLINFLQTSAGMETLKYALLGIAAVVGGILLNVIIGVVTAAGPLILAIGAIVAAGAILGPLIKQVVDHFGGLHGILQRLQPVFDELKSAWDGIVKAFQSKEIQQALQELGKALPELLPTLKAIGIVVGVTLVVAFKLLVLLIHGVAAALPYLIDLLTGAVHVLAAIGNFLIDVFSGKVDKAIRAFFGHVGEAIGGFFNTLGTKVHNGLSRVGEAIGGFFSRLGTRAHNELMTALAVFGKVIGFVTAPFRLAFSVVLGILGWFGKAIGGAIAHVLGWFKYMYHANTFVHAAVDGIRTAWHKLTVELPQKVHELVEKVHSKFEELKRRLHDKVEEIKTKLTVIWDTIKALVEPKLEAIHQAIFGPVKKAHDDINEKIEALKLLLGVAWDTIKDNVKQKWDAIGKVFSGVWDTIRSTFKAGLNDVIGFLNGMIDKLNGIHINVPKVDIPGGGSIGGGPGISLPSIPHIPMLASGGMMTRAGLALVGERGPELRWLGAGDTISSNSDTRSLIASLGVLARSVASGAHTRNGAGGDTYITANFPNATNRDEIKAAFLELQQEQYRGTRRAGYGGGTGAHLSIR